MNQKRSKSENKILFVHQGYELYGSDKVLLLNIKATIKKYPEKEIVVIIPKKGDLYKELVIIKNVKIIIKRLGVIRKYDFKRLNFSAVIGILTFYRLIKYLNRFDLVFINSIVIIDYILASRFVKPRVIIHVHELPRGIISKIFCKALNFSSSDLIFVSEASKKSFKNLLNRNQYILWNGVKAIRQLEVSASQNKIKILLIGRINAWKGQLLLVKAVSLLTEVEKKSIQVRIVGDVYSNQQHLKQKLLKYVVTQDLENIIEILPFTKTPEVHYNWADVVIVPSLSPEPFGLVATEAMSVGKLVIAAKHGGLTEIVRDNVTGLFFEPGNVRDLAEKISLVIRDPISARQKGENGISVYKKLFTEEIYITKLVEIL